MNPFSIFSVCNKRDFENKALEIFRLQAKKNLIYKKYIEQLGIIPEQVKHILQIPFLPIEFFKSHKVITIRNREQEKKERPPHAAFFLSSGTTSMERSKHYVSNIKLYETGFRKGFELFYGDIKKYSILALLPSYYEKKNSSLLYMVNDLMKRSGKKESMFYQNDEQQILCKTIGKLLSEKKKVILFGVSYALLDLVLGCFPLTKEGRRDFSPSWRDWREERIAQDLIIMETGGMKGKRKEITREEFHKTCCEKIGVKKIHSEYGMTELLSQAYSKGDGIFRSPSWMKVFVRDVNDPFQFLSHEKIGALSIIDLANIHSCSFIAAQDIGRTHRNNSFEVLGRMDNSDLRGCNLLAE